jgi:hypothetical protein
MNAEETSASTVAVKKREDTLPPLSIWRRRPEGTTTRDRVRVKASALTLATSH